jgi:hypothetical protein
MPEVGSYDEPPRQEEIDEENPMTTFYYGPALDSELDYRRHSLQHDAQVDRLVRDARLFTRAARPPRSFSPVPRCRGRAAGNGRRAAF